MRSLLVTGLIAAAWLPAAQAATQDLAGRIRAAGQGAVAFRFPARDGVCGDGESIVWRGSDGSNRMQVRSRGGGDTWRAMSGLCTAGPIRVTLTLAGGRVANVDVRVGGPADAPPAHDLGDVPAAAAVDYLLSVLAPETESTVAHEAILAAVLADAENWPGLLALARSGRGRTDTRRTATHWLAMAAHDRILTGRAGAASPAELDVKRHAVFALSQRREAAGRDALLEIAERNADADVRAHAVFWLGQTDDARALDLFERILRQR